MPDIYKIWNMEIHNKSWYQDLTNEEFAAFKVGNCEIYRFE